MNKEQIKKFYIIEKQEFSYFYQKMVNKKYRFYTRDYLPPTYKSVLNIERELYKENKQLNFQKIPISDELKERFKQNIEFQNKIKEIIKKRVEKWNYRCGIIKAKTWIWKSHICMDIINYLQLHTLILVSNKKLMQEMIDKFTENTNYFPSQYGDKKKEIWDITIMTKKSFQLCEHGLLQNFNCIIVDECHQWFTKKFWDKLNTVFHNKDIFLYGLSATPSTNELNESDLEKYYGKIIEIKQEYDFIPEFIFINYKHLNPYEFEHYSELRWLLWEDQDRFSKQMEHIRYNLSDKCSLILCDRISEINSYYLSLFKPKERNVIIITWETKIEDDKKQLEEAKKDGKPIIIIWSIQKCSTWFDFPIIDTVFIFSAIKFENTVIQSIWRALRKSPWKTGAKIYIWNDKILDKQRLQKQKAIYEEYWVRNQDIEKIYINYDKKRKWKVVAIF